MAVSDWDDKFMGFIKNAGEHMKKVGQEAKAVASSVVGEAQDMVNQAKDPETKKKAQAKLDEVTNWSKKWLGDTADKVSGALKSGVASTSNTAATLVDDPNKPKSS